MTWFLVIMVIGQWGKGLSRPLWPKPPAESISYYFDPYPPDEILPTPLPNELSCWGCCCLFPGIGGYLGYKFLKGKASSYYLEQYLNFSVSYSLGSAVGHSYPKGGLEIIDLRKKLYWLNRVGIGISCNILGHSRELDFDLGYTWGREKDKYTDYYRSETEVATTGDWIVSAFNPMVSAKFLRSNNFLALGIELYYAKGILNTYWRSIPLEIKTKGLAPGGIVGVGCEPELLSSIKLNLTVLLRHGVVKISAYSPEEVTVSNVICFSGIYCQIGIKYPLVRKRRLR